MGLFSSTFILHILICGRNIHKGLIFLECLQPKKCLKSCLPKENLLETTISLISRIYRSTTFLLMKIVFFNFSAIKRYSFSSFFTWFYYFIIFLIYNFLLFFI